MHASGSGGWTLGDRPAVEGALTPSTQLVAGACIRSFRFWPRRPAVACRSATALVSMVIGVNQGKTDDPVACANKAWGRVNRHSNLPTRYH